MSVLIKPAIALTCLIGLSLAAIALINIYGSVDLSLLFQNQFLMPALIVQLLASTLFVLAWKLLLKNPGGVQLSWQETSSHIGVTLLGKYIPGKIWGLMGRGVLLSNRAIDNGNIANLLILDQALTFSSGIFVLIAALLLLQTVIWSLALIPLLYFGFRLLVVIYPWVARQCFRLVAKGLAQTGKSVDDFQINEVNPGSLILVFLVYLLHWILTGIALSLLVLPLLSQQPVDAIILIVAAIPAAMLTGFVALWAPGGIGVREVVMLGILSIGMPVETAGVIAIVYRFVCILVDIVIGGIAIAHFARNDIVGFLPKA